MTTSTLSRTTAALLLAGAACASHATLITFDERPWVLGPDEYAFYSNPIDGWYDHLGVNLDGAYLQTADSSPDFSNSQYILGWHGYGISFTDATLPTYVSLDFGSPMFDYRATVTAIGANGQAIGSANTGGWYLDETANWVSTPFNPRSFASFHSDEGIAGLRFETETFPRLEAKLDNLYFGNVPAIPEPATLALWAAGLGVIGAARRRRVQSRISSARLTLSAASVQAAPDSR